MLTIDGNKIKSGHAFNTTTGVVPFIVVTVHHDDTVTFVGEKNSYRLRNGRIAAGRNDSMTVSAERFKEIYKEPIESMYEREDRAKAIELERQRNEYQRNKDHGSALRMNLLMRAIQGEDITALSNELDAMIDDAVDEYAGY